MLKHLIIAASLVALALPAGAAEKKQGWVDKVVVRSQAWADNHPNTWKLTKFSAKTTLFALNCGAAVANIIRY